ncbi:MAG: TolC family protein [Acidobacteriota bacterium]
MGVAAVAASCAHYQPAPLPTVPRPDPSAATVAQAALQIDRAGLTPLSIDLSQPLTPDQLAVIAVIANPDLRSERARLGVAEAQVFAAGLLPDPQFSLNLDRPASLQLVTAVAAGLGMDVSSFATRPLQQRAARAVREQVRLDLAWQEWQVAGQARLLAARERGLERVYRLTLGASLAAADTLVRTLRAVGRGDLSAGDLEARRISAADLSDRARVAERELQTARLDLRAVLGLSPGAEIAVADPPPSLRAPPDSVKLIELAYTGRLDLAALRAGYESQDAQLRLALLQQYPRLNLSLNAARDTGAVSTTGIAVAFDLPLWNRNRGAIAIQDATREQLRTEYEVRLFATRATITALSAAYDIGVRQQDELATQIAQLRGTVAAFERASARGDIAPVTAEAARQALTDRDIALAALSQTLAEQYVALELASGALIGDSQ